MVPADEAAAKRVFRVLNRATKAWKMLPREWVMATTERAVEFEGRFIPAS
ncbi:MAG: hypothetical protein HWD60_12015 [Defluviicoccus sp.]|nr:MAG: hypothetical protein HWD60_12015 [Defluviicoccus sp.]